MARCGCAGTSGCSCVITAGAGVDVYGSGTGPDPYVIAATTTSIAGTFQVTDTPTVDLSLGGSGSLADPYDLSAQVTLAMEDLTNAPAGSPANGDVWIWNGTAWVYGPPSSGGGGVTVVTGDGLTGDGSAADPVSLVAVVAQGLEGIGTTGDPLEVNAATWADIGHTDDSTQDDGLPVYFGTAGQLLIPRGVYLWHIDSWDDMDPDGDNLGPNLDTIYRNPGTLALGAHDDPIYRYLVLARRAGDPATLHGESELYHTFNAGMSQFGLKVASTSERADSQNLDARSAVFYLRRDGQITVRSDAVAEGAAVTRPIMFAQQQGSADLTGGANAVRSRVVTFAAGRFTNTPRMFLQSVTGSSNASTINTETWVNSVTASSAQINVNRSNNTDVTVWWFAVQETSVATAVLGGEQPVAALAATLADDAPPTGVAVCHTAGCANAGVEIEVPLPYTDADGITYSPTYECGVCGLPITDVQEA